MNKKFKQLKKRNLISFTDLKRGINFSSNYANFSTHINFFDLIMESTQTIYDLENVLFMYQNQDLKKSLEENFIGFQYSEFNNSNIHYLLKPNIFNISKLSSKLGNTIFYFKLNSWGELLLEIHHHGYEVNYDHYLEISKIFNQSLFVNIYNERDEEASNYKLILEDIQLLDFKEEYFEKEFPLDELFSKQKMVVTLLNYENKLLCEDLNESYASTNLYFNCENSKYELEEIKIFNKSIKQANKIKANYIVIFDDGFKSFRIAYKEKSHWVFLDADRQASLFLHFLLNKYPKSFLKSIHIFTDYELSEQSAKIASLYNITLKRDLDLFDKYDRYKNNFLYLNENFFLFDNFSTTNNFKLILDFLEKYTVKKYIEALQAILGFEEFKKIEKKLTNEEWELLEKDLNETNAIDDQVAYVQKIFENDELAFYQITTKQAKLVLKYYKLDEWIYLDASYSSEEKLIALEKLVRIQNSFRKYSTYGNRETYEFETKRGIFKILSILAVFLVLLFITFYFIIGFQNTEDGMNVFWGARDTIFFYILLFNPIVGPIIMAIPFYYVYRFYTDEIKFRNILVGTYIVYFLVLISPIMYLSMIGMFWYLKKFGLKTYQIASGIFTTILLMDSFAILANGTSLIYGLVQYHQVSTDKFWIITIFSCWGIIFLSSTFLVMMALFLSPKVHSYFIRTFQKIALTFNFTHWYENKSSAVEYNLDLIRTNIKVLGSKAKNVFIILIIFLVHYFYWELIMFSAISIVDPNSITFSESIGYDTIIWELSAWVPIPGHTGISEALGARILNNALGWSTDSPLGYQTMFLYRTFGWYLYGLVAAIVFFTFLFKTVVFKKSR